MSCLSSHPRAPSPHKTVLRHHGHSARAWPRSYGLHICRRRGSPGFHCVCLTPFFPSAFAIRSAPPPCGAHPRSSHELSFTSFEAIPLLTWSCNLFCRTYVCILWLISARISSPFCCVMHRRTPQRSTASLSSSGSGAGHRHIPSLVVVQVSPSSIGVRTTARALSTSGMSPSVNL